MSTVAWILYADISEHHVRSIFIGHVNKTTYEDGNVCSETSAHKIQTPVNHPNKGHNKVPYFCLRQIFEANKIQDNEMSRLSSTQGREGEL